jgi:mannose-6-phosphate isomerase-like protein (cupin superfamily)
VRVDFDLGAAFGRQTHPGEEIIYVLEGSLEYQIVGKQPVTLKAGEVLFIPAGTIHEERRQRHREGARHVCARKKGSRPSGEVTVIACARRVSRIKVVAPPILATGPLADIRQIAANVRFRG